MIECWIQGYHPKCVCGVGYLWLDYTVTGDTLVVMHRDLEIGEWVRW